MIMNKDAGERRRIEEKLAQSEALFRNYFELGQVGMAITSLNQEWLQVNRRLCEMLGYTKEELCKTTWTALTHQDDLAADMAQFGKLLSGEIERYSIHKRFFRKDGSIVHTDLAVACQRQPDGTVDYVIASLQDITERKQAEEQLRSASQYARSLIEASLDPLVTISAEGKITDVNEATERVTGIARAALVGSDFSDYFTEPDKARSGYREVFEKGFVTDYPLTLRHVSGRVREVLYNAGVYRNGKGEVAGVFAAARDITELKRAEESNGISQARFSTIFNQAPLGIALIDSFTGHIYEVNPRFAEIAGRTVEEMMNIDWMSITHPDDVQEDLDNMALLNAGKIPGFNMNKRYLRPDGSSVWIDMTIAPLKVEQNISPRHLCMIDDITERKRAEAELSTYHEHLEELVRERTEKLEVANKDLEGFAYSVSHDLRVPLRAIDGFSRILLTRYENQLDDEGKRYLNVVRDNTRKMGKLIDDILEFSRMGRLGMSESEIDMGDLAHDVLDELKPSFAGRELSLEIKQLPLCRGDRAMLRQVWLNLLANAIKFTQAKALALVEVGGYTEGADSIYYVKDNGAGFDMQYAEKLFGVFQRLHGIEEFDGTGIGLAIVKRVVVRHGGRVWAEGKVDAGAIFYFSLPN